MVEFAHNEWEKMAHLFNSSLNRKSICLTTKGHGEKKWNFLLLFQGCLYDQLDFLYWKKVHGCNLMLTVHVFLEIEEPVCTETNCAP
jgi:hypothetical protein